MKLTGGIINALVIGAASDRPDLLTKAAEAIDALNAVIEIPAEELASIVRYAGELGASREEVRAELRAAKSAALVARIEAIESALDSLPKLAEAIEAENWPSIELDEAAERLAERLAELGELTEPFKAGA